MTVVIGDGKLVVPVDFAVRRPDPKGPGARGRNKLGWPWVLFDQSLAALARRGVHLPAPSAAADRWLSDSTVMHHVGDTHQGALLVQGKSTYVCTLQGGQKVKALISCRATIGPGVKVSMHRAVAMPGCELTVPPMATLLSSWWTKSVRIVSTCSAWPQKFLPHGCRMSGLGAI
jgi:hypothetical protein